MDAVGLRGRVETELAQVHELIEQTTEQRVGALAEWNRVQPARRVIGEFMERYNREWLLE